MKKLSPRAAAATAGSVAAFATIGGLSAAVAGPGLLAPAAASTNAPHCLTPEAFNHVVDSWPAVRTARENYVRISTALAAARREEKSALNALNSRPAGNSQLLRRLARYTRAHHARASLLAQQRAARQHLGVVRSETVTRLNLWLDESRCESTTTAPPTTTPSSSSTTTSPTTPPSSSSSTTTSPTTPPSSSSSTTTPPSSSSSTTTPASALTSPTGLSATATTPLLTGALKLSWNSVSGATSYSVYRNGVLLSTLSATTFNPTGTTKYALATYTVTASATGRTTSPAATLSAGVYQGTSVADQRGRTVYGYIQTYVVVTSGASKTATGCWATYPTTSDSGTINPGAITNLCNQVVTKHPVASTVASLITAVSGASATSPAFNTSLQAALTTAGMP